MPQKTPFKKMPKGTYHLPLEQAVYIPSKDRDNKPLPKAKVRKAINDTRKKLSNWFGGYTSTKTTGGYVSVKKKLIKEKVVKVTSFSTRKDFNKNQNKLKKWLMRLKKNLNQESIGYEYETDLFYF